MGGIDGLRRTRCPEKSCRRRGCCLGLGAGFRRAHGQPQTEALYSKALHNSMRTDSCAPPMAGPSETLAGISTLLGVQPQTICRPVQPKLMRLHAARRSPSSLLALARLLNGGAPAECAAEAARDLHLSGQRWIARHGPALEKMSGRQLIPPLAPRR